MNKQSINDDDWYELDAQNNMVRSYSKRVFQSSYFPIILPNGNRVVRGLKLKHMETN